MDPKSYERYSRQILFGEIGEAGQQRLLESSAVIVGCGALGTALANLLVRAGVGKLRIVDRDFVEPSNLQRQTLFEESDAQEALPKAVAAERRLRAINSGVSVEGIVADVGPKNAVELLRGFPLILDGTDNFETRFLLNDVAIHLNVPWIYAAVVASYGVTLTVRPGETACLACALESESGNGSQATGTEDTCDTVGVLGAAAGVIASIEAAEAIKLLTGKSAIGGRAPRFLRRLVREISIRARGAQSGLPRLRPPRLPLPRRRSATSLDDVRPRLRANPRAPPPARSRRARQAHRAQLSRRCGKMVFFCASASRPTK